MQKKSNFTHVVLHTVGVLHSLHNSVVGIDFAAHSSKIKMNSTMRELNEKHMSAN